MRLRLGTLIASIPIVNALLVVPSSPQCADLCGNTLSSTSGAEITCDDADYASSAYGATFEACIACELSSPYYDTVAKQSDLQWALYNLRYALSWCLFGFGNNTKLADTPCLTSFSCAPLQSAFEFDSLNQNASEYSYCPLFQSNERFVYSCSGCLAETGNEYYLSNFVTILDAACLQQPTPGNTLSIQGNVFSTTTINVTTPSPTPLSTYTPQKSVLSLGGKIGIAVAGLIILIFISGCCIIWHGKRRRRAHLASHQRQSGYSAWLAEQFRANAAAAAGGGQQQNDTITKPTPGSPFFDSPQSQRPLVRALSWDHHTHLPDTSHAEKAYFSPYNSNYNSPVSAVEHQGPSHAGSWPVDKKGEGDDQGERIEMVSVGNGELDLDLDAKMQRERERSWQSRPPPVLQHPGHGRVAESGEGTMRFAV